MDNDNLKTMWQDAHKQDLQNTADEWNNGKILMMKHSKMISRVLSDLKWKIYGYLSLFIIFLGLMLYALVCLHLHFTLPTLILFFYIGLFLIIRTISAMNRFWVLTKTENDLSVKESVLFFRKKLKRIKTVDFVTYLVYFYTLAIWSAFAYLRDIGGVQYVSRNNAFQVLLLVSLLMVLLIPWLIRYQHHQQYKGLYSSLKNSDMYLDEGI
jgi:hypothetical protein